TTRHIYVAYAILKRLPHFFIPCGVFLFPVTHPPRMLAKEIINGMPCVINDDSWEIFIKIMEGQIPAEPSRLARAAPGDQMNTFVPLTLWRNEQWIDINTWAKSYCW